MRKGVFAATMISGGLILLGASPMSSSSTSSAGIWGTVVVLETGEPLAGAQVFISELRRGTVTSGEGLFYLRDVRSGSYEVRVQHPCFWRVDVHIEVEGEVASPVRLDAGLSLKPVRDHAVLGGCASFLPNSR